MGKEAITKVIEKHSHCKARTTNANLLSIVQERGHYVAYVEHRFYYSGDTYQEVIEELSKDGII